MRVRNLERTRGLAPSQSIKPNSAAPMSESGLPGWLDERLKPGVGPGIFNLLKFSLVGLILTLGVLYYNVTDDRALFHIRIFIGMSCVLLCLVVWFVGELAKGGGPEPALQEKRGKGAKAKGE